MATRDPHSPTHRISLSDYQVSNLLWALEQIMDGENGRQATELDTGDWAGEIRWKLKELGTTHPPNGYSIGS